ncbi:MAG TPA: MmcB family DNA repair protein, partial [Rhizomicrobium sp.]|nr:MmcB family DNA repair protein [Rhizomicrobium sp.]
MISTSTAAEVARGVSRLLLLQGYAPILEFTLPNGRRLDVAAIGPGGEILGVEIKVALADLRGDGKWP